MSESIAGVIANPASGKDIRRLVSHASVFGTDEKINILRRALLGLDAAGVRRILFMSDPLRLVERALAELALDARAEPAAAPARGDATDTTAAARAMQAAGARVLLCLGGDGTHRALARGARDVPLVPVSTGTNNVFPQMLEGTVAGLAAGALATGAVDAAHVARRCKQIEIALPGGRGELALIDAAHLAGGFVASRAIWEPEGVRELVLTRAQAHLVGMAAIGGMLDGVGPDDDYGLHVVLGPGRRVRAAIAPGLIREVQVASAQRLPLGAAVKFEGPGLLAVDGERELAFDGALELAIRRSGPPVVDVARCLAEARRAGFLCA